MSRISLPTDLNISDGSAIQLYDYRVIDTMPRNKIKLTKIWTSSGQVLYQHCPKIGTSSGQALVPKYKHNKTVLNNINSKNKNFKNSNSQSVTSSGVEMSQNTNNKNSKQNNSVPNDVLSLSKEMDNLKVSNDKDYNEPL